MIRQAGTQPACRRPEASRRLRAGIICTVVLAAASAVGAAGGSAASPPAVRGGTNIPVKATFDIFQDQRSSRPLARGAIHGVRRIEGGTVLYYSLGFIDRNATSVAFVATHRLLAPGDRWDGNGFWATPQLVDPRGKQLYSTLVERESGPCLCSPIAATEDRAGKLFVLYSVFPPLPPETRSVNVAVGFKTVVRSVPVEDAVLKPEVDPSKPVLLGTGWPRIDAAAVAAAPDKERSIVDLETRVTDFGNQIITVESPAQVSIELSADVLFAVDSAVLTPQAQASIAKVAQTVNERSKGGTVSVIGHTDDTGPDTRNDPLSQERATAVKAALEPLVKVPGLIYSVEGKGEREPTADNTTDAGRQANRRVTVTFAPRS